MALKKRCSLCSQKICSVESLLTWEPSKLNLQYAWSALQNASDFWSSNLGLASIFFHLLDRASLERVPSVPTDIGILQRVLGTCRPDNWFRPLWFKNWPIFWVKNNSFTMYRRYPSTRPLKILTRSLLDLYTRLMGNPGAAWRKH